MGLIKARAISNLSASQFDLQISVKITFKPEKLDQVTSSLLSNSGLCIISKISCIPAYLNDFQYRFHLSFSIFLTLHFSPQEYIHTLSSALEISLNPLNIHHPHHHQHIFIFNHADWRNFPQWEIILNISTRELSLLSVIKGNIKVSIFKLSNSAKQYSPSPMRQLAQGNHSLIFDELTLRKGRNNNKSLQILKQVLKLSQTLRYYCFGISIKVLEEKWI